MTIRRRDFMGAALAAGVATAQTNESAPGNVPTHKAKVTKLFKAPDPNPNALEATKEGLWIADQVTERAALVDWKTGKVLRQLETESHNTSGIAVGGGYLWMGANGSVNNKRPARPTDKPIGEVLQVDLKTGKTVKLHQLPWGGGMHGLAWAEQTQTLWATALSINAIAEVNPMDNFRILRLFPVRFRRAHGLEWDNGAIWCVFSNELQIHKLDAKTGRLLEMVTLTKQDPDPHGMCMHERHLYYCDAGLSTGVTDGRPSASPHAGYVCRIDL